MRLSGKSAKQFRWDTIVRLSSLGKSQTEISEIVQLCQSSVSRVLSRAKKEGKAEVKSSKGGPRRLSEAQSAALKEIVLLGSVSYGFEGEYWTNKRLMQVIAEKFGVSYKERQISTIMKRLGLSKQRFQKKDVRQSAEKVSEWKSSKLPELKKKVKTKNGLSPIRMRQPFTCAPLFAARMP